jgi:hypothetical protein
MSKIRAGNIMARMRMIVLFDQSVAFNGLVMGTSNKTELLLGYSTIFGDSAAAIQPIGDLYKTQVRQLARHLGVPEAVIGKAPSADLWDGQTDEGELGLPTRMLINCCTCWWINATAQKPVSRRGLTGNLCRAGGAAHAPEPLQTGHAAHRQAVPTHHRV